MPLPLCRFPVDFEPALPARLMWLQQLVTPADARNHGQRGERENDQREMAGQVAHGGQPPETYRTPGASARREAPQRDVLGRHSSRSPTGSRSPTAVEYPPHSPPAQPLNAARFRAPSAAQAPYAPRQPPPGDALS